MVVVGGATLNLLGIVRRSTSDLDMIVPAHRDETGELQHGLCGPPRRR